MLMAVQLLGDIATGDRVADACSRKSECFRERAQDDHSILDQVGGGDAAVLEVRLVDDERTRGGKLPEFSRRIVRPTADRQRWIVVPDLGAGKPHGYPKERVGRIVCD